MDMYARKDEKITCPSGHVIYELKTDAEKLDLPIVNDGLCSCGAVYYNNGVFHVEGGWRL
jgi:hypothetical protein